MSSVLRYAGQAVFYAAFAAFIGYFATLPSYRHFPQDRALLRLAFNHGGAPVTECRKRTREELAKLPPNMRKPQSCPRGRVPLVVELALDGETIYRDSVQPTGLFGDGPSKIYQKFELPVGQHNIEVRMRDSRRESGFDYERTFDLDLGARHSIVIDFRAEGGGFVILK